MESLYLGLRVDYAYVFELCVRDSVCKCVSLYVSVRKLVCLCVSICIIMQVFKDKYMCVSGGCMNMSVYMCALVQQSHLQEL